jgi:hypothetical protein
MPEFYAHSVEGKPQSEWHLLEEHLLNVAELAKKFGDEFGSGEWAYLAGLWLIDKRVPRASFSVEKSISKYYPYSKFFGVVGNRIF